MNYGGLIRDAFWLTWRNRFLWVFGFFLGGGQVFNLLQNANNLSQQGTSSFLGYDVPLLVVQARRLVLDNLVLFLVLAAALVLVGIFLSLTSQGALVNGVAALHRGEERNFSSTLRAGLSNFWRVLVFLVVFLLISLGLALLIFLLLGLPVVGVLAVTESLGVRIAVIALAVLLFIVLLIVVLVPWGIIGQFGLRALVADREGVFGSFGSGYRLFRRRLGRSLLIWIIGIALSVGTNLALLLAALLLGLLLAVPALILFVTNLSSAGIVAGVVAAVVLLIAFIVAAAAVNAFNHAYWTLAYLRLTTLSEGAIGREA